MATADDHRTYSIRQLCREFDATARALRFYEDKGLLTPARKGQTRVYDARDRARLKLILRGRRIGFTLQEIQEMLDLYDRKDHNVHQMAVALRRHRAQIAALTDKNFTAPLCFSPACLFSITLRFPLRYHGSARIRHGGRRICKGSTSRGRKFPNKGILIRRALMTTLLLYFLYYKRAYLHIP